MHNICISYAYVMHKICNSQRELGMPNNKVQETNLKKQPANKRLIRVTISLDAQDYLTFERLGEKERLSRSWLIRKAMREFLDRTGNGQSFSNL